MVCSPLTTTRKHNTAEVCSAGSWPPDQALNTTILQDAYQKNMQNFVTKRYSYIGVTT